MIVDNLEIMLARPTKAGKRGEKNGIEIFVY